MGLGKKATAPSLRALFLSSGMMEPARTRTTGISMAGGALRNSSTSKPFVSGILRSRINRWANGWAVRSEKGAWRLRYWIACSPFSTGWSAWGSPAFSKAMRRSIKSSSESSATRMCLSLIVGIRGGGDWGKGHREDGRATEFTVWGTGSRKISQVPGLFFASANRCGYRDDAGHLVRLEPESVEGADEVLEVLKIMGLHQEGICAE